MDLFFSSVRAFSGSGFFFFSSENLGILMNADGWSWKEVDLI